MNKDHGLHESRVCDSIEKETEITRTVYIYILFILFLQGTKCSVPFRITLEGQLELGAKGLSRRTLLDLPQPSSASEAGQWLLLGHREVAD